MIRPSRSAITCFLFFCLSTSAFSSPSHARNGGKTAEKPDPLASSDHASSGRTTRSVMGLISDHSQQSVVDQVNLHKNLSNRVKRSVSSSENKERQHENKNFETQVHKLNPLAFGMGKKLPVRFKRDLIEHLKLQREKALISKSESNHKHEFRSRRKRRSIMRNILQDKKDHYGSSDNYFQAVRVQRSVNDDHNIENERIKRDSGDQGEKESIDEKVEIKSFDEDYDDGTINTRVKRNFQENVGDGTGDHSTEEISHEGKENYENLRIKRSYDRRSENRNDFSSPASQRNDEQDNYQNIGNNAARKKRSFDEEDNEYLSTEFHSSAERNSNNEVTKRIKRGARNGDIKDAYSLIRNLYEYKSVIENSARSKRSADHDIHSSSGHELSEKYAMNDREKRSVRGTGKKNEKIFLGELVNSETLRKVKRSPAFSRENMNIESENSNTEVQHEARIRRDADNLDATQAIAKSNIEEANEPPRRLRFRRAASEETAGDRLPMTREDSVKNPREPAAIDQNRIRRSLVAASRILRRQQQQQQQQHKMVGDATQQVSSYTAYELSPAATKHKGSKGTSHKTSGHKAGFVASSGHKSGIGHKADKGFEEAHEGAYKKKGESGHSGSGGKTYAGGEHKSNHHGHSSSGKKGAKGHAGEHKAHHSKGSHADGYKAQKNKKESGGKKSFYDESDHKGYHSKYDHFDSYHESSTGGSEDKSSHSSLEKHDSHGKKGYKEIGKEEKHKKNHSSKHGHKDTIKHQSTSKKQASHEKKHESKH